MLVLGIESSCDDSAIGIYDTDKGLLTHSIYSQTEIHSRYGGVVPELASRDHIRKILPLIATTLEKAHLNKKDLDAIAYTCGPGLIGSLMVGSVIGKSLGYGLNIPTLGVNHLEAHLMAVMLEEDRPEFPFITLLVSGGHTMLIKVLGIGQYHLLGETVDDAVGEAFDKTAKLLGLPYPGGPALAALAEEGNSSRFKFPRPMLHQGLNFSFSGLKTAVLNAFMNSDHGNETKADLAASFEQAAIDTLTAKCKRALKQEKLSRLCVVGGVGANKKLRTQLKLEMSLFDQGKLFFPRPEFCTDNGAMVAYIGAMRLLAGEKDDLAVRVRTRWPITELF